MVHAAHRVRPCGCDGLLRESRNYMVCSEIREDCRFCGFDTAYVSARSLKDKWVLDSLRSAGLTGLSDTPVI